MNFLSNLRLRRLLPNRVSPGKIPAWLRGLLLCGTLVPGVAVADQICNRDTLMPELPPSRLEVDGANVKDSRTRLMWRRCFEGKSGKECDGGELAQMSWPTALQHVEEVNVDGRYEFKDWRLPNIKELVSIADLRCSDPALDLGAFPGAPAVRIWSSTPYRFYPHFSWYVDTKNMMIDHIERSARYGVLLVRNYE